MDKRLLLICLVLIGVYSVSLIHAANLECLVKTSDSVLSNSPKDAWTNDMFAQDQRGNSKQGYIINCENEGHNWGSDETDPTKYAIITIPQEDFNATWLEPEFTSTDNSRVQDCLNDCSYEDCEACSTECVNSTSKECIICVHNYWIGCYNDYGIDAILTERKYKVPLTSFIGSTELTNLKTSSCGVTTPLSPIEVNISDLNNLVVYNNWTTKPLDWVAASSTDSSEAIALCDYYLNATLGKFTLGSIIGYPLYNSLREKVVLLSSPAILTSSTGDITLNTPWSIWIKSQNRTWDGVIHNPEVENNPTTPPTEANANIEVAFKVGSNVSLTSNKAIKLTIFNEAGNSVGYVEDGTFYEITDECGDNTQATNDGLSDEGDCKIDLGDDLIIWTKHLSEFVVYTIGPQDADADGVLDDVDLCLGTSEGEAVNADGCSCSQVTMDDGNICTDDICSAGVVTYTNNNYVTDILRNCPENSCNGDNLVTYPEDGYDYCADGSVVQYSCDSISSEYSIECDTDDDNDGVLDVDDLCPNTVVPESFYRIILNNYGDIDGDKIFETRNLVKRRIGRWFWIWVPSRYTEDSSYTLRDTHGCTCNQILDLKDGNNLGERLFGCRQGTIQNFIDNN